MKRTIAAAVILVLVALPLQSVEASLRSPPPTDNHPIVLQLSDLRSAYLQRAGVVRYDRTNRSPEALRQQLQRHFDVVMGLLLVSTPRSIEIALARVEAASGHRWSASERADERQQLLAMRYLQLRRLAAYRDRGQFPLNEGQAVQAVPIFVDRHDTACAVGHLMRLSGWSEKVARIQTKNNLVYVPDAMQSAVTAWALTSGITWEEAALIQPAYPWPGEFDAAAYEPGESTLERNGLRFENFQLSAVNYVPTPPLGEEDLPPNFCTIFPTACTLQPTSGGARPTLQGLGLLTGQGFYAFSGFQYPQHTPNGTHWLAIAGERFSSPQPSLHSLGAAAAENRGQLVTIRFDVSAIAADKRINGMAESSYLYQSGFSDPQSWEPPDATYYLKTTIRDGTATIDTLSIDQATVPIGYHQKLDTSQFTPRQKISVESNIWLRDGVAINTYLLDFNLVTVPEPAGVSLALVGLIALVVLPIRGLRKD